MKSNKNKFSMTFYNQEQRVMFLEFVNNTEKAVKWVENKGIQWTHAMIYERKTRKKLDRILNSRAF